MQIITLPPPPPFEPAAEELDLSPQGPAVSVENVLHTWGGVYVGEWVADQPHGRGTLQLRNGQVRISFCDRVLPDLF